MNLPRVIVGKRRRKLSQAKCGEGAREYRAGGTVRAESWLGHGFSSFKVYGKLNCDADSIQESLPSWYRPAEPSIGALA